MKHKIRFLTRTRLLELGACLGVAVMAAVTTNGFAQDDDVYVPDHECYWTLHCNYVPVCPPGPTPTQYECDSCTLTDRKSVCVYSENDHCWQHPADDDGCGTIRQGLCSATGVCSLIVTSEDCGFESCRDPEDPPP